MKQTIQIQHQTYLTFGTAGHFARKSRISSLIHIGKTAIARSQIQLHLMKTEHCLEVQIACRVSMNRTETRAIMIYEQSPKSGG